MPPPFRLVQELDVEPQPSTWARQPVRSDTAKRPGETHRKAGRIWQRHGATQSRSERSPGRFVYESG